MQLYATNLFHLKNLSSFLLESNHQNKSLNLQQFPRSFFVLLFAIRQNNLLMSQSHKNTQRLSNILFAANIIKLPQSITYWGVIEKKIVKFYASKEGKR